MWEDETDAGQAAEDATIVARNADLAAIVEAANRSKRRPAELGDFRIAAVRGDAEVSSCPQIATAWRMSDGAAELRYCLPSQGVGTPDVSRHVRRLLDAADEFVLLGPIWTEATAAQDAIGRAVASGGGDTAGPRLSAVGISIAGGGDHFVTADVEMLGHDLTRGIERIVGCDIPETLMQLEGALRTHTTRAAKLDDAARAGCSGWIDGAAREMFARSGLDWKEAMRRLANHPRLRFAITDDAGHDYDAFLHWQDGTIVGDCTRRDGNWGFEQFRLLMRHPGWPETVLAAVPRRRIGDVARQPFVPDDATITCLPTVPDGWLAVDLAIAPIPIYPRV